MLGDYIPLIFLTATTSWTTSIGTSILSKSMGSESSVFPDITVERPIMHDQHSLSIDNINAPLGTTWLRPVTFPGAGTVASRYAFAGLPNRIVSSSFHHWSPMV